MSFPRYPKYKNNGVKWLQQLPEHWRTIHSRRLFRVRNESAHESDRQLTASQKFGILPQADFVEAEGRRVVEMIKGADTLRHVEPNDFIISLRSFQGGLEWSKVRGSITWHYVVLVPVKHVHPPFFAHLFKSTDYIQALRTTTDLIRDGQDLRYSHFVQVDLPIVPIEEQIAIAEFLDRETSKIDALVAEQRRLMDLLKEKRQAVISHAVTKGLNPHAPMKDSGIEWLGEVPAHWEVKRLRYLCDVQTGDRDTEHAVSDGTFPFFVRSQEVERINSKSFDCEAVLTAGDGAGVGKVFHYFNGPFDFHQRVYMMNNFRGVSGHFFFHYLRENFFKVALEGGAKSTVDSLRRPMFMGFPVCVPPHNEQSAIIQYVVAGATKFDRLAAEAERAIDLLLERRTALISAAVTGQIDVRARDESRAAM